MNKNQVQDFRNIYNGGISFLQCSFAELDRKAQFWMGLSLTGLLVVPSYSFQKYLDQLPYFIPAAGSLCICFILAIFFLSKGLKQYVFATGVTSFEKNIDFGSLDKNFESEQRWEEFKKEQAEFSLDSFNINLVSCQEKGKNLSKAESLLFFGIPICLFLSFIIELCIRYKSADGFNLFDILDLTLSRLFFGGFVGICVCVLILLCCHNKSFNSH